MNMRFGKWKERSLYTSRSGSLMTVTRELARYKLDLAGVQEVRRDKGGEEGSGDYNFSVVVGSCKCGNEPSSSTICREFVD
jgi:hypothetical protein